MMIRKHTHLKYLLVTSVALLAASVSGMTEGHASPVSVDFAPPKINLGKICKARRSDAQIKASWAGWDGKSLPRDMSKDQVAREMARLFYADSETYFAAIKSGYGLLLDSDPNFKESRYLIAMIELYLETGRYDALKEEKLLEKLEQHATSSDPKVLNFLADLHLNGQIADSDEEKGLSLKVQAARLGNPQALLDVAQRANDGADIEGWDVAPDVAVTLAFGALLGKLNGSVCDRIGRIAREYSKGEIVVQNYALSEEWHRFAADLGDDDAAWKTAQMHLSGDYLQKNNDHLLKYLEQASDSGILSAQLEYAQILIEGALVSRDLAKARQIYDAVEKSQPRIGLIRKISLMEAGNQDEGAYFDDYSATLSRLAALEDAPAWVFRKIALITLDRSQTPTARNTARALLEKAISHGDKDSELHLATMLLEGAKQADNLDRALDLLYSASSNRGKTNSLTELQRTHRCFGQLDSDLSIASFWKEANRGAGNESLFLTSKEIRSLNAQNDPLDIATLQSTAMYGRASALTNYAEYLASTEQAGNLAQLTAQLAFWRTFSEQFDGGRAAIEVGIYRGARSEQMKQAALDNLEALSQAKDPHAAIELAELYLYRSKGQMAQIRKAEQLMQIGKDEMTGKLLKLYNRVNPDPENQKFTLWNSTVSGIRKTNDTGILLKAALASEEADTKERLFNTAVSVMTCNLDNVLQIVQYLQTIGDRASQDHWLKVASQLVTEPWQMIKIGDIYASFGSEEASKKAYDHYMAAFEAGSQTAVFRLMDRVPVPDNPFYDPALAVEVFDAAIERADGDQMWGILAHIKRSEEAIQSHVLKRHSLEKLYRISAEAEQPAAMRELAKLLRQDRPSAAEVNESSQWLKKAAEQRDVEAMVLLANSYAFGIGMEPSQELAHKWLAEASQSGDEKSQIMLSLFRGKEAAQ
ncbi:sel1 repeat family protein [Cohaesibacter sp. CAU 1516]|uniref:tetratricopeptide repeat protein n=1 Tax=Cohaesibacter sp. CAU 1516 TaxID=2576038 RepID=UPI0010FD1683|nr:SEL1-like repeat protein [Cohaesibacter sp. CAU 1516]TLP47163.1 sel1 repeat family protein [Cohaesibacter sp. CAU 1516]